MCAAVPAVLLLLLLLLVLVQQPVTLAERAIGFAVLANSGTKLHASGIVDCRCFAVAAAAVTAKESDQRIEQERASEGRHSASGERQLKTCCV